jgi:hypothetical protein
MHRRRTPLATTLAALALAASGCLGGGDDAQPRRTAPAPAPAPAAVEARADLGAPAPEAASMSGLLHGLRGEAPPDAAIRPLAPRLWRSIPLRVPHLRAARVGATYQYVLSDLWGYPGTRWHGRGPPWRDLEGWARVVRRAARAERGRPIEWDVWNEPDNPAFFTGTREQFFRLYDVAARVLVDELGPDVVVGGPSTTKAAPEWTAGLLRHCRGRCPVRFVSYHENLQPAEPIPAIEARVRELRERAGVPVVVNESVGQFDQYRPGAILAYLHHMEAGGAAGAARSCWPDLAGADNCTNGTLGGLLTPAGEPRSAWWAYRLYAAGVEDRVQAVSSSPAVTAIATRSGVGGLPQVLLARGDRAAPGAPPVTVQLSVAGLRAALEGARRAALRVELLPDTGEAPLPEPVPVQRRVIPVPAGVAALPHLAIAPNQALVVTLERR